MRFYIIFWSLVFLVVAYAINSSVETRVVNTAAFNAGKTIVCGANNTAYNSENSVLEGGMVVKYDIYKGMLTKHSVISFSQLDMCRVEK